MGRKILVGENPSIHPILSLSLLVAYMAAIVALISSLCISRKKSPPPTDSQRKTTENLDAETPPPNETITTKTETTKTEATILEPPSTTVIEAEETKDGAQPPPQSEEPQVQLPLPPPPGLRGAASCHYRASSTASESNGLLASMSTRVQGVGMSFRQQSRREELYDKKRDKKLKHEDSIWKKQIILGEKCRVPDEDDAILYDEKGNRISTFHSKTPGSLPLSRQTSFIDPDAIPSSSGQK